jgi:hypothetical protein
MAASPAARLVLKTIPARGWARLVFDGLRPFPRESDYTPLYIFYRENHYGDTGWCTDLFPPRDSDPHKLPLFWAPRIHVLVRPADNDFSLQIIFSIGIACKCHPDGKFSWGSG